MTLYGRRGCHLCDDMAAALEHRLARPGILLERVDIDTDPALKARFGWDIPLLFEGEQEICRHEFNAVVFAEWLNNTNSN